MSKKVLFIYERKLSELPPLLTLMQLMKSKGFSVTVTVSEEESQYNEQRIKQIPYLRKFKLNNKFTRLINRKIVGKKFFASSIPRLIEQHNYDLIWLIIPHSPSNIFVLKENFNAGKKLFCTIYELFDTLPKELAKIKPLAQRANRVIVPEFNRAHILRSYLDLNETPTVIPNKPLDLPELKDANVLEMLKKYEGKKIILYQGHISKYRDVEPICKAVENLHDYVFVLMGRSEENYAEYLLNKYSNVDHIEFILPPNHLEFTSKAFIGIVSYSHITLNGVFCAPNKIWEYSGYGVPMICNDIPGLVGIIEHNGSGICVDFDDSISVYDSIMQISNNYSQYSDNAKNMYESCNIPDILDKIVEN